VDVESCKVNRITRAIYSNFRILTASRRETHNKNMNSENPMPPAEIPVPQVKVENPPPPPVEVPPLPAPPPAANLIVNGVVKSEREVELEKRLTAAEQEKRQLEMTVSERERDIQELKKIPVPRSEKLKRKSWLPSPVIGSEDE